MTHHEKQVDKSHYCFKNYLSKKRWISLWHQINEIISVGSNNVLEIGPGPSVLKNQLEKEGIEIDALDIDPELNPDYVGSVLDLPFASGSFDCVCAFQMLEHIPYTDSLTAFSEMKRVADQYVIISLPDSAPVCL